MCVVVGQAVSRLICLLRLTDRLIRLFGLFDAESSDLVKSLLEMSNVTTLFRLSSQPNILNFKLILIINIV